MAASAAMVASQVAAREGLVQAGGDVRRRRVAAPIDTVQAGGSVRRRQAAVPARLEMESRENRITDIPDVLIRFWIA